MALNFLQLMLNTLKETLLMKMKITLFVGLLPVSRFII